MDSLTENELELARFGRRIEAIKAFRARTGATLKAAKDAVDRDVPRPRYTYEPLPTPGPKYLASLPAPTHSEKQMFRQGNKILAIKAYRTRTGFSLKESKDAVENLEPLTGLDEILKLIEDS